MLLPMPEKLYKEDYELEHNSRTIGDDLKLEKSYIVVFVRVK